MRDILHGTSSEAEKITGSRLGTHGEESPSAARAVSGLRLDANRCLIVDDEPHLRRVLARVMQSEGFDCEEAGSGVEALERLRDRPVTLLLTDLHMPELDGAGLLREVRRRYPDTAVVLVTAVADVGTAVSCLAAGAMDYLTKPFHIEEVRARVQQALSRRRLVLENRDYQERLEERVSAQAHRLEELFLASIQSLAEALEVKDPYTHGHSLRVARYSTVIAQTMGLEADLVRQIELGGKVHDIGKIGVREAILNKPGALTEEEYQHIMIHPMVGWRLLLPLLGEVPHALAIVRSHHERFDGRGSPDGLVGEEIPIEARIAAIADTFDAMTSARPYRPGMPLQTTLDELRRCGNAQFDPRVLMAFLDAVGSGAIETT
jgi:response regulator RpfG family c-di-GMP phosphodiesterase